MIMMCAEASVLVCQFEKKNASRKGSFFSQGCAPVILKVQTELY